MANRDYKPFETQIDGQRIVDYWYGEAPQGARRRTWWYKVECVCDGKPVVIIPHSTATRAVKSAARIRCESCKRRIRAERNLTYQRTLLPVRAEPLHVRHLADMKPVLDGEARKILAELGKKPKLFRRVMEIARPYIAAAIEARMQPQTAQILKDALEMAQRGESVNNWTADTRWEGLKLQSYDLSYHAPAI